MKMIFDAGWFTQVGLPALEVSHISRDMDVRNRVDGEVPALVRRIVDSAIRLGASDLHWEPGPTELALRTRHNGTLIAEESFDKTLHPRITTHIKALADLDITERRRPQDGRIRWNVDDDQIDIRVSTVPGAHGEKTVLRILDPRRLPDSLVGLGMDQRTESALKKACQRSRGLILVTGPTGSGKSTTLYTLLKSIDREHRNVMTVEDPVEYELEGVTQVAVYQRIGRTFASVLRSFLRQDPDVLLVGEVRDLETAEVCIRASLTGHLVLSTLHTNDAAGSLARLLDMGVPPYLLASSLSIVCSQRLLRRLCPSCSAPDGDAGRIAEEYGLADAIHRLPKTSRGCDQCRGTGVIGRIGIFETLMVSRSLEDAIRCKASTSELENIAKREGLVPLLDQGLDLVNDGEVQLNEVLVQVLEAGAIGRVQ